MNGVPAPGPTVSAIMDLNSQDIVDENIISAPKMWIDF